MVTTAMCVKLQSSQVEQIEGGCQWFIRRKQRFCSNHAINTYCHSHQSHKEPEISEIQIQDWHTLESVISDEEVVSHEEKDDSAEGQKRKLAGRKQNLKRRMKRMLNPFFVRNDIEPLDWENVYSNTANNLHLDIGTFF
jgi:hypothetical protein